MSGLKIVGIGHAVPERILTNQELEQMVDTSDEWIVARTGIRERRISEKENTSVLGFRAAQKAMEDAGNFQGTDRGDSGSDLHTG